MNFCCFSEKVRKPGDSFVVHTRRGRTGGQPSEFYSASPVGKSVHDLIADMRFQFLGDFEGFSFGDASMNPMKKLFPRCSRSVTEVAGFLEVA